MTWVKLDDAFFRNSKARSVGKDGRELYLAGLCYCAGTLTDGFIPKRDLALVAAEAEVKPTVAKKLRDCGLWQETDDGWLVPDFLDYNKSAEQVRLEREEGKRRAAASRERTAHVQGKQQRTYGEGSQGRSGPPSSSRPLGVTSVSQSSSVVPADPPPTTTDEILTQTWAILAVRDEETLARDTGQHPRSRKAWLRSAANNRRDDHESDARRILEAEPGTTPKQLADSLDRVGPAAPRPKPFGAPSACDNPDCSGGRVLDDGGVAVACPKCRAAS